MSPIIAISVGDIRQLRRALRLAEKNKNFDYGSLLIEAIENDNFLITSIIFRKYKKKMRATVKELAVEISLGLNYQGTVEDRLPLSDFQKWIWVNFLKDFSTDKSFFISGVNFLIWNSYNSRAKQLLKISGNLWKFIPDLKHLSTLDEALKYIDLLSI